MRISIPIPPLPPQRISVRRPLLVQNTGGTVIYVSETEPALVASVDSTGTPHAGYILEPGNSLPEITRNAPALYAYSVTSQGELEVIEEPAPVAVASIQIRSAWDTIKDLFRTKPPAGFDIDSDLSNP